VIDDLIANGLLDPAISKNEPPAEKLQSIEDLRKALGNGEMAKAKERVA
jgi:hypothetical protein